VAVDILRQSEAALLYEAGAARALQDQAAALARATADDLRAAVAGHGDTVVAVCHQPDCSEIVLALTGVEMPFPVGTFHEVDL
jgi:phosphohistidine phosphatase SixA